MRWILLFLAVALTVGCGGPSGASLTLRDFTLSGVEASASAEPTRAPSCLPERREPIATSLPAHLERYLPAATCDYVLAAQVPLPPGMRGQPLTIAFPSLLANAELTVQGEVAVRLDPSPLDVYHPYTPLRFALPARMTQGAELSLRLRVHHTWMRSAWVDAPATITVGDGGNLGSARSLVPALTERVFSIFAIATALVVVLLYGFTALVGRGPRRHAYALFALGGACGLAYPSTTAGYAQAVLGVYDLPVMSVLVIIGAVTAMHFSHAYFGLPAPSRVWFAVILIGGVLAVVSRSPFVAIRVMGPVLVVVTIANTIFQGILCLRLRKQNPRPANLYLVTLAWPATAVFGAPDMAAAFGLGEPLYGVHTAGFGIGVICLLQAVALARDHVLSLERADALNQELATRFDALTAKAREVEVLNDELRRQIAARSKALAEKLAQMDVIVAATPPNFEEGDVIDDRYRVVRTIGAGGMGAVYEVERVADAKHFALKALSTGGDAQAMARFAREAEICANVKHPNVVSIVDVDIARAGYLYLVMELAEGGTTLYNVRRRNRDVPWTLAVLGQVTSGLAAIHKAGVVHRDLKPTNILMSRGQDGRKPSVKITDFGISSLREDNGRTSVSIFAEQKAMTGSNPALAPASAVASGPADAVRTVAPRSKAGAEGLDLPPLSQLETEGEDDETRRMLVDLDYDPDDAMAGTIPLSGRDVGLTPDSQRSERPRTPPPRTPAPRTPLTETGIIFGTPQYMAPELTSGSKLATRASDIFSVGIIAFELLVGRRPFREVPVSAALEGRPLPVATSFREACPSLGEEVAATLDLALSNDPALRPTAQALHDALQAELTRLGVTS